MNNELLVQKFQIGQRVRRANDNAFVIRVIYFTTDDRVLYASGAGYSAYEGDQLTLAPKRPPYVPSERLVVVIDREERTRLAYLRKVCRCETDAELAARHAVERAEYDRPCPADPVIYNARGESIGITGRTSLDGPGAE